MEHIYPEYKRLRTYYTDKVVIDNPNNNNCRVEHNIIGTLIQIIDSGEYFFLENINTSICVNTPDDLHPTVGTNNFISFEQIKYIIPFYPYDGLNNEWVLNDFMVSKDFLVYLYNDYIKISRKYKFKKIIKKI